MHGTLVAYNIGGAETVRIGYKPTTSKLWLLCHGSLQILKLTVAIVGNIVIEGYTWFSDNWKC